MKWLAVAVFVVLSVNGGGGVTKPSGVSQFWTDDYKIFEHVYGKTSDKELYRATALPSFNFGIDAAKLKNLEASEKKEKVYEDDTSASGTQYQTGVGYTTNDGYNDFYAKLLAQQELQKNLEKEVVKPTKPSFKFLSYGDFKPISQHNNPETYSYLKTLEQQQAIGFPQEGVAGFKPYLSYGLTNPENTNAYKSIQDVLDAHAASRQRSRQKLKTKEKSQYVSYGGTKTKKPNNIRLIQGNDIASSASSRCVSGSSGRCRKRSPPVTRGRSRPVVRKIKHTIISD